MVRKHSVSGADGVGQGSGQTHGVQQSHLCGHNVCSGFSKDGGLVLVAFEFWGTIVDVKYALPIKNVAGGLECIWEVGAFEGEQGREHLHVRQQPCY